MNMIPIFALMLAPNPPVPINEKQMHDIGCVAVIGIIAQEQRSGKDALQNFPDVRESGKRWAGIIGDRVMTETGQPRELVAFAIKQAVEAEQAKSMQMNTAEQSAAYVRGRFEECSATMDMQLAASDGSTPLAKVDNTPSMLAPAQDFATDEPDKIALYRTQLDTDSNSSDRIRRCQTLLKAAQAEIIGREGKDSRDARAFAQLLAGFDARLQSMPQRDGAAVATEDADVPSREDEMARCIRLGESLALALPPE